MKTTVIVCFIIVAVTVCGYAKIVDGTQLIGILSTLLAWLSKSPLSDETPPPGQPGVKNG